MELWIRSQDKTRLLPINDELYIPNSRTNEDFAIFYKDKLLGWYKTKERALEVMDEIQSIIRGKYATSFDYKIALKGFRTEEVNKMLEMMAVYEMPKE